MSDLDADRPEPPIVCARCTRAPRDTDDRLSWITSDADEICPGCLTLNDSERLRNDSR